MTHFHSHNLGRRLLWQWQWSWWWRWQQTLDKTCEIHLNSVAQWWCAHFVSTKSLWYKVFKWVSFFGLKWEKVSRYIRKVSKEQNSITALLIHLLNELWKMSYIFVKWFFHHSGSWWVFELDKLSTDRSACSHHCRAFLFNQNFNSET